MVIENEMGSIETPFVNLSRTSTEILAVTKIYVDYTLPIEKIGKIVKKIVGHSQFWNKKIYTLNISDMKESTIELGIDASAKTPGDAWNLQCEVREKLILFIQKNFPHSLPKTRIQIKPE